MSEIPFLIPREIYFKDPNSFRIDVFEISKAQSMEVKRVYILSTLDKENLSGKHAHLNQSQVLYLINGSAELNLTNRYGNVYNFKLGEEGVFIPSNHWIELKLYPNSTVLCIASKSYEELRSIKNFDDFLNYRP